MFRVLLFDMPAAGFPAPCRAHADSMPAMLLRSEDRPREIRPTARRELHQVRPSVRVHSRICSRYCVQCLAFIGSVTYAKLLHINLTPCWFLAQIGVYLAPIHIMYSGSHRG